MHGLPAAQHLVQSRSAKISSCTVLNATSQTKICAYYQLFSLSIVCSLFHNITHYSNTKIRSYILSSVRATAMFSQYSLLAHVD